MNKQIEGNERIGGEASAVLGGRTAQDRSDASSCTRRGGLPTLLLRRGPGCSPSGCPSAICAQQARPRWVLAADLLAPVRGLRRGRTKI